jgi:hypothetical protein
VSTNVATIANMREIENKSPMHLWQLEPIVSNGAVRLSAVLEIDGREPFTIWFEIPEEFAGFTTESAEPFLLAAIFKAMGVGGDLRVHGHVAQSLLRNLAEFQAAWHEWLPQRYRIVNISADTTREDLIERPEARSIAAFSGGVDSCYTVLRHSQLESGPGKRNLEAALLVHGFDISLDEADCFARAAAAAKQTLDSVNVKLITMKSNLFNPDWENTHGAAVASCLMTLQGRYEEGLIASSYTYTQFHGAWGSNPITDHLLSSKSFTVSHDGSGTIRGEKLAALAKWREGFDNLRVCFSAPERDKNCGICPKCVMTLILCRSRQLPPPKSFPRDFTTQDILSLDKLTPDIGWAYVDSARRLAESDLPNEPWLSALIRCANFNRVRLELLKPQKGHRELWRKVRLALHEMVGLS